MADSAPQTPTFASPADNARDMADTLMGDIEGMLQGEAPPQEAAPQENLSDFGWDERSPDFGSEFNDAPNESPSVETPEVTVSSPGSGPAPSQAPAPALDPTQQMLAAVMQQMQVQQQQFAETLKQFAPKPPEPPPEDPFADLPQEFQTPEIKKFADYMRQKVLSPLESYKQEMEQRIQQATQERQIATMRAEAASLGKAFAQELGAQGQDAQDLADWFHDQTVIFANKYGGTPAQYAKPVTDLFNKGVALKQAQLNSKAKAAVAQRHPGAPARPQSPGSAMSPNQQFSNRQVTNEIARAAGYKSAYDAALDGDAKVHQMWARQGAQGK